MSDNPTPRPEPIVYDDTVVILDADGNVVPRMVYSSIPGRAPSPERNLIDAIEAGLTAGDDLVVETIDGTRFEVLPDGRRIPIEQAQPARPDDVG
jgi:hypothetical protein